MSEAKEDWRTVWRKIRHGYHRPYIPGVYAAAGRYVERSSGETVCGQAPRTVLFALLRHAAEARARVALCGSEYAREDHKLYLSRARSARLAGAPHVG